jgi:hypothetical protein
VIECVRGGGQFRTVPVAGVDPWCVNSESALASGLRHHPRAQRPGPRIVPGWGSVKPWWQ